MDNKQTTLAPELLNTIINSFTPPKPKKPSKSNPTRIKVNGKIAKLNSGKSLWRTLGFAKNALNNHINGCMTYEDRRKYGYMKTSDINKELVRLKIVEYVSVDESIWD